MGGPLLSYFYIYTLLLFTFVLNDETSKKKNENAGTDIAQEKDDRLLLFATLDGNLIAVDQQNGKIRWKIKDKPIVQVPLDTADAIIPIFLPDPRDGSLYLMGNTREPLKKLPFTIPQLVAASPCRSSDGIMYTGKKKDTWFKMDPTNGNRKQILGWGATSPTCPAEIDKFIYIGRTKYSIMMVDSKKPTRHWNVTYYDYTSATMSKEEMNNYNLVHFSSTSSGRLITLDRRRGNMIWDIDLGSPVVAAYVLDNEGLIMAPFTSLANHTISYFARQLLTHDGLFQNPTHMKLYPTLYVGEHLYGLYAIPSLVDSNVVTITASDAGPLLLSGPHSPELPKLYPEYPIPGHNYRLPYNLYDGDTINFQSIPNFGDNVIIFTGHYNVPRHSETKFIGSDLMDKSLKLITHENSEANEMNSNVNINNNKKQNSIGVQTDDDASNKQKVVDKKIAHPPPKNAKEHIQVIYRDVKYWINQQENKGMKLTLIILSGCVVAMFWYLQVQVREFQNISQNGSRSSQQGSFGRHGAITAISEELPDGLVRVGKITFHPEQLLGKGCEGTFVYRGEFDSRRVAVKRLLPECFTFADREVALLRESDAHPHVIRYYCMEQDRMFRYIALELCQATLSEYVQGKCDTSLIKPLDILRQATSGLAHLHSLDIVHRDIKPHNVLLSVPNSRGEVRAMISDFGLCKKLQVGRVSFSRRSGVTGTDGWIAPEMLNGNERTTCAVDLFSMGCLFYYVLSNGKHPFGDTLRRQANILSGEWDLSQLKDQPWQVNLQIPLLSALISEKPEERPPCNAVLAHPMFWNSAKILAFFQDVSDRVEKAESDDPVLQALEENGSPVVRMDWRVHIHEEVARDLRKYRTYRGDSVRDLLRALRNKKHHFRELSKEAQDFLGEIPEAFTNYWTHRFPLLLVHAWITMQCVAHEKTFQNYYNKGHFYSLRSFKKQVENYTNENPDEPPENYNLSEFSRTKSDEGYDYYTNAVSKSPKKVQRMAVGDQINRWKDFGRPVDRVIGNVGLYRNLSPKIERSIPTVSLSDINLTVNSQNHIPSVSNNNRSNVPYKRNTKKKKSSKNDEPLVWAIRE